MRNAFLLAAIGTAMISGCSTTNQQANAKVEKTQHMTKEQFIGEWKCITMYREQDLWSSDSMDIKSDGSFRDSSYIYFPIPDIPTPENSLFSYNRVLTGSWALDGNKITYHFLTQGDVIHEENKNSPLWEKVKEKKLEELVRVTDKKNYQVLSASSSVDESITLSITHFIKMSLSDIFTYDRKFGDKTYVGACARNKS
jgi:hypothetical protein